ncbi:glycosyl hydrolase [Halalkalibacterium halodurans]|uniref:glycosyl hydrolase n=1 Tax=Halalkalibacterium halodurans TaxID=86665 RepID=UPI002AA9C787|nr:glycosyl hydrolase [Halalkalibacterium halodurans]MDY7224696.1 glycosyl hydrolase [Halalkalibacterium halodurans]MDY7243916.1 glycosyl hydrolase [Halalkalibacterium halodurans]
MRNEKIRPFTKIKASVVTSVLLLTISLIFTIGNIANAESEVRIFEAEDAILNGLTIKNSEPGFSGTGYVGDFENSSQSVTFQIEAPKAGLYNLNIGYGAIYGSGKVANVIVNGEKLSTFTMGSGFGKASAGKVLLNSGLNTISITPNWTWFTIDYIEVIHAPEPENHNVEKTLINPNATDEAKALISYLVDNFGEKILAGQHDYPNTRPRDLEYIYETTGKYPAVLGLDFIDNSPSRVERGASADETPVAIDWWNKGGIVTFTWHWNAPKDLLDEPGNEWWSGFYTRATTFDVEYALKHPKSEDYMLLIRDIDVIAGELKKLQEANVPVLWRPLHEAEGGWFWWGAKGPESTKELWRLMYDRMTNYHNLNNLIWVWNSIEEDWYPGDEYVDIVSFDSYPGEYNYSPMSREYEALKELSSNKKLIAIAENGPIPDPDLLQLYHANYSWFATWNGDILRNQNSEEHLRKVYNHDYVITLDKLPNLKTYREDALIQTLSNLIDENKKNGKLTDPLLKQLNNRLWLIQDHFNKKHYKQAVQHLDKFKKSLNNKALQNNITEDTKIELSETLDELRILLSKRIE